MARTLPHRSLKLHFWPPVLFPAQQTQAPAFPVLSDQSVLFCVSHICSVRLLTLNTHSVLVPNRIPSSVFSECLSILSSDTKGFRRNVPQMRQDFSPLLSPQAATMPLIPVGEGLILLGSLTVSPLFCAGSKALPSPT